MSAKAKLILITRILEIARDLEPEEAATYVGLETSEIYEFYSLSSHVVMGAVESHVNSLNLNQLLKLL